MEGRDSGTAQDVPSPNTYFLPVTRQVGATSLRGYRQKVSD